MTDLTLSRRNFICNSLLLATVSPLVFGNEDKIIYNGWNLRELNDQINQGSYIPNFDKTIEAFYAESRKYRAQFPPKTYSYGSGERDSLDVYAPANAKNLPIMIWIYGGEWKYGSKEDYASAAPNFMDAKVIYIPINYENIPPNTMGGLVDQCRRAFTWIWNNADRIGGDPTKIYVSGHSAGGHLTNMMACTDWTKHQLPAEVIKGCVVMSGWTDLYPISLTDRQRYLKLTSEDIKKYSPGNLSRLVKCPMIISFGGLESPYMQEQSSAWALKLQSIGKLAGVYRMKNLNHLQMPMQYVDKDNQLFKATMALMNIV